MEQIIAFLATSPLLLIFLVIGLGFILGSIRIGGFSLGPSAVLFAGIFVGAVDSRLRIPDLVYVIGLVLFVYAVGLQSGPTFFASFGRRALRSNLFAVGMILLAALISYAAWSVGGLHGASVVGAFCGALTNTPALAASIEAIKRAGGDSAMISAPVVGYSVCYPFGVIGVLLGFHFIGQYKKKKGVEPVQEEQQNSVQSRTFRVTNVGATGAPVSELLAIPDNKGFLLSRMCRGTEMSLVYGETQLALDDLVTAVGSEQALERAERLLGVPSQREIQRENQTLEFRRIEVSDSKVAGKKISDLNLQELLDSTITRVRRGDTDFVPTGDTVLERGDRIRVLTWAGNIERLNRFFGDSMKEASETDFLSLSIGLVFGVLLGMLPLPLPGGSTFTLGFAGGPLVVGLLLGWLRRTGPIIWGMPFGANLTLRQLGLVLFLAGIGTKAGDGFLQTVAKGGWQLMAVGGVVTTVVTLMAVLVGGRFLHLSFPAAMGLMSGIQTQPACLAYANERSKGNAPNVWYASVYPASMIAKIILAQILVGWVLR